MINTPLGGGWTFLFFCGFFPLIYKAFSFTCGFGIHLWAASTAPTWLCQWSKQNLDAFSNIPPLSCLTSAHGFLKAVLYLLLFSKFCLVLYYKCLGVVLHKLLIYVCFELLIASHRTITITLYVYIETIRWGWLRYVTLFVLYIARCLQHFNILCRECPCEWTKSKAMHYKCT